MSKRAGAALALSAERPSKVAAAARAANAERQRRLSVDIPESLYRRIRLAAAEPGSTIRRDIIALLERAYPAVKG